MWINFIKMPEAALATKKSNTTKKTIHPMRELLEDRVIDTSSDTAGLAPSQTNLLIVSGVGGCR